MEVGIPTVVSAKSLEEKRQAFRAFFQSDLTFLVIDNMDEPPTYDEENLLNTLAGKTKILITTRADIQIAEEYNLSDLDMESALCLFYRHYKRKFLTYEQIKDQSDFSYAESIVVLTGYNALFIELIGKMAYADHKKLDDLWKKLAENIFGVDSKHLLKTNHGKSHHSSPGKLLEQLQKLYGMSMLTDRQKEIMSFIALFPHEHSIFFDVFDWAGFEDDENNNIEALLDRGWIERTDEGYMIHQMVKGSIELQSGKKVFDEDQYENLINELCDTDQYMPSDMVYTVIRERIVVPETICSLLEKNCSKRESTATLFNNIAEVYHAQGEYEKALDYFSKALAIREKVLGKEQPLVAETYNNIAGVYIEQEKYKDAMDYLIEALAIDEKMLEKEHPSMATIYNNIAFVYCRQGEYEKALGYFMEALSIREKVLGKEHPSTALMYNNIAEVYYRQGEYKETLDYLSKALAIYKKVLGKEHPSTAMACNNIGWVYYTQRKCKEALAFLSEALAIDEKALGKEHRYLPDENRLVIDEESAAVIREIYSKLLGGKLPREIAKELSERGIERPFDYYTRVNGWKPRTEGPEWPEDAVYKIGRNPKFCGRWEKVIDGRNVAQDCDPIVSPEDYEAVQKIFDSRRHHRIKVAHMENPLNRILTDQETGAVLILNKNKYTGIYDYHFRPRKPKGVKYERICMYYDEAMRQLRSLLSSEKEKAEQAADFICSKNGIAFKEMMVEEIHSKIPVFMDKVLHIGNQKIQAEIACSAGEIDDAEYEKRICDLDERCSVLDDEINTAIRKIRDIRRAFSEDNPWVKLFLEYDETEELTLKYVRHFVESAQMYRFETIILKTRESDWKQMIFNAYEGVYGNGKDKQTG